jgi:hypothetical protein
MTSRREFLEAAALSALPAVAGTSLTAGAATAAIGPSGTGPGFDFVLFDERYPQARSITSRIGRAGAALHPLADGDVTQVWLSQIGPAWRRGPAVVAGLTARPALFCLEQLALSSGLRVIFHAEHVVHLDGRTEHSLLRGAEGLQLSLSDLSQAGRHWPARIADALAAYRPQATRPRFGRSEAALDPALPPQALLLTSWIIAAA